MPTRVEDRLYVIFAEDRERRAGEPTEGPCLIYALGSTRAEAWDAAQVRMFGHAVQEPTVRRHLIGRLTAQGFKSRKVKELILE